MFRAAQDYLAFEELLQEHVSAPDARVALFAYCLMPNHWHMVVSPAAAHALSSFMHRLTTTHARAWQHANGTNGAGRGVPGTLRGDSDSKRSALSHRVPLRRAKRVARILGGARRRLALVQPVAAGSRRGGAVAGSVAGRPTAPTWIRRCQPSADAGRTGRASGTRFVVASRSATTSGQQAVRRRGISHGHGVCSAIRPDPNRVPLRIRN